MTIIASILVLGGLTLLLALMLTIASRKLYVYEDPRIDVVEGLLPHANCGACGFPGCRPFAEALVQGAVLPVKCSVNNQDGHESIAKFLGIAAGVVDKQVARLACAGGENVARKRANYNGIPTCRAAALVSGGDRGCSWGCLGYGDCEKVCDFDAIRMDAFSLPVVDEQKCTACGDCVLVCPKDLFSLQPVNNRLWVACKSREAGDAVLAECAVGCTACGKCAMDAPVGLINMEHNLPVIHYGKAMLSALPADRCPTGAIVWLDPDKGPIKGSEAIKIIRKTALEVGES